MLNRITEDNPETGWPWRRMTLPNSWWVAVQPSEQLHDERAGWKAPMPAHLEKMNKGCQCVLPSYLLRYWQEPAQPCTGVIRALGNNWPLQWFWKSSWFLAITNPWKISVFSCMKLLIWAQLNLWGNNLENIPKNPKALDPNLREYVRRSNRCW